MRYIYTNHFQKRFDERFSDVIQIDRLKDPYSYYKELNNIMDESSIERAFLNDTSPNSLSNRMRENHIDIDGRFDFFSK